MRIVIVGMGEVGQHVVAMLEREGHDVVAVDMDRNRLEIVEEHHDVGTVCGYGASPTVLKQAGAGKAGLVAAVTNDDEVNLVSALIARDLGAERSVARLQGHELVEGDEGVYHNLLGIDLVVNPQILVAQELARSARSHGALDVQDLAQNRLELVEMEIGESSSALNRSLADLKMPGPALIAAVVRDGDMLRSVRAGRLALGRSVVFDRTHWRDGHHRGLLWWGSRSLANIDHRGRCGG